MKYPDVCVKHATSPSHRDRSRQVVIPRCSNSASVRTKSVRPLCRDRSTCINLPARLRPASALRSGLLLISPPGETAMYHLEKFRHSFSVTHIAIGIVPTIAWKASPTRTPPPICTSAPFLKPRWSQDRRRCERSKKYTMRDFPQSLHDTRVASLRHCCNAAAAYRESKFLNRREESRVSQFWPHPQKIFTKRTS
jgi:hypothetical protein